MYFLTSIRNLVVCHHKNWVTLRDSDHVTGIWIKISPVLVQCPNNYPVLDVIHWSTWEYIYRRNPSSGPQMPTWILRLLYECTGIQGHVKVSGCRGVWKSLEEESKRTKGPGAFQPLPPATHRSDLWLAINRPGTHPGPLPLRGQCPPFFLPSMVSHDPPVWRTLIYSKASFASRFCFF